MHNRLAASWEYLRTSFWLLPAVMAVGSIVLAALLTILDQRYPEALSSSMRWIPHPHPDASRTLLSALVGAIITVLSVVFSITIVALTLAASQLGPRLLRTFTADRGNQIVLGTFVGTFLYCLLILWLVGLFENTVPELSIFGALLLAITSVGVLIFFIHHMSQMIQSQQVVIAVGRDLQQSIEELYPPFSADEQPAESQRPQNTMPREPTHVVRDWRDAYLQFIDTKRLMHLAVEHDLQIWTCKRPGRFIIRGEPLACVMAADEIDDDLAESLASCFLLGRRRTPTQDVEFAVDQLVEVALRALSPSLNDPFTAMQCIDHLGAALVHLSHRRIPPHEQFDDAGVLRLTVDATKFAGLVDAMFDQIRQSARSHVSVMLHLLGVLERVLAQLDADHHRHPVWAQAKAVYREALRGEPDTTDRDDLMQQYSAAARVMRRVQHRLASRG